MVINLSLHPTSSPRVCSTKTRIKTQIEKSISPFCSLREYVPLKQGLRREAVCCVGQFVRTPRVCSTKTRIKTGLTYVNTRTGKTPRVCSTKTRIKTFVVCTNVVPSCLLREYVPLKQGLRLSVWVRPYASGHSESMFH